jgi:hopene-associated glycosyltransferase HpnB
LTIAGLAVLAVWLYIVFGHGWFWLVLDARPAGEAVSLPSVTAVTPARDEAPYVGQAISSLAKQRYGGSFRIVLVDDASSDGTADLARAAAPPELLAVISGRPLPAGWTGKLWAMRQGIERAADADFLLLTDADIVHTPGNIASLVGRAQSGGYDLVSHMATLRCESFAEGAVVPAFVFFFFLLYPPAWIRNAKRKTAGAAGGCILIRRAMLERIGGIEAIRGELIDDCALARAVKRTGGRIWLGVHSGTRSIRAYGTFGEIGRMISRTAFTQLGYSAPLLAATVLGMAFVWLMPPALAMTGSIGAAVACLLMVACYLPVLRFYRRSVFWAPLLPLIAAFYMGCTVASAVQYWRGAGGLWKGRAQAS